MSEPEEKAPAQPQAEEVVVPEGDPVTLFFEAMTYAVGVDTVFGEPITAGDRVIIAVAETGVGGGVGFYRPSDSEPPRTLRFSAGGGGGGASTRPVAAIVIGAEGVQVKPVFDANKLVLTGMANAVGLLSGLAAFARSMRRR